MHYTSETIDKAVDMFASLPSIGKKTAQRLVYHILKQDKAYAKKFSDALIQLKDKVLFCEQCFNYSEISPCQICNSNKRNSTVICVVADPNDVVAIEKTNEFNGKYHVLHGILNPLEGITANDIKIKELIARLININEVILAINPSVEGEITIQYIAKLISPLNIKVSRIASGIPMGSAIEHSDEATLARALEARISM